MTDLFVLGDTGKGSDKASGLVGMRVTTLPVEGDAWCTTGDQHASRGEVAVHTHLGTQLTRVLGFEHRIVLRLVVPSDRFDLTIVSHSEDDDVPLPDLYLVPSGRHQIISGHRISIGRDHIKLTARLVEGRELSQIVNLKGRKGSLVEIEAIHFAGRVITRVPICRPPCQRASGM